MTVIVIVRQSIEKGTFSLNFVNFIANCLLLTSWIPPQYNIAPYLGVAWYLSTSVFLYFCSRRIYRFLQQKSLRTTYISMCCAYGLQVLFILWIFVCNFSEETRYWLSYEFPVFRLGDFFIGCCLGKIFLENNQKSYRISANSLEIFCVFFTAVCLLIYTLKIGFLGLDSVRHSILLLPSSVVTVYLFAQNKGKLTDLLTNQPSIWLARISPYGFLIHQEIIYQTKYLLFGPGKWQSSLHKVIVCAVSFFVTVLLSVFYVKLIRRKKSSK